jgi:transposase
MRQRYLSDLTDGQWSLIEPLIPVLDVGRPREVAPVFGGLRRVPPRLTTP